MVHLVSQWVGGANDIIYPRNRNVSMNKLSSFLWLASVVSISIVVYVCVGVCVCVCVCEAADILRHWTSQSICHRDTYIISPSSSPYHSWISSHAAFVPLSLHLRTDKTFAFWMTNQWFTKATFLFYTNVCFVERSLVRDTVKRTVFVSAGCV